MVVSKRGWEGRVRSIVILQIDNSMLAQLPYRFIASSVPLNT